MIYAIYDVTAAYLMNSITNVYNSLCIYLQILYIIRLVICTTFYSTFGATFLASDVSKSTAPSSENAPQLFSKDCNNLIKPSSILQ